MKRMMFLSAVALALVSVTGCYVGPSRGYRHSYRGTYVQPAPVYVAPRPVYVRPAPVYAPARPVYVQPAPVYAPAPRPVYAAPAPASGYVPPPAPAY